MSESELRLYIYLLFKSQRYSTLEMFLPNAEIQENTGLSSGSITAGRDKLVKHNLIRCTRGLGGAYTYTLWNPEKNKPFEEQKSGTYADEEGVHSQCVKLTTNQANYYFEVRLAGRELQKTKNGLQTTCPFHEDHNPSLSIQLETGLWHCFGCNADGDVIGFEAMFSGCDRPTAIRNVAQIIGDPKLLASVAVPEVIYPYFDENHSLLYQVVRFPGKQFAARRRKGKQWLWNMNGTRRVLYRLPEVIPATHVIVTEGEKDAEAVNQLELKGSDGDLVAVTTCPFGAGKWDKEFSEYLKDKHVLIFADQDQIGMDHAKDVRAKLVGIASDVRIVGDWGDASKDVHDYLCLHKKDDLIEKVGSDWFYVPEVVEA